MKPHVLVVEDDDTLQKALRMRLEIEGFDIDTANDGDQAADKIALNGYDLVIMDIIIPKNDGANIINSLRQNESWRHLIYVISNLEEDKQKEITQQMADRYFVKSDIKLSVLLKNIHKDIKKLK